jgi:tetratricopeptide (TPR) repeat protein
MIATDAAELVGQLISLRRWSGQPSLRTLRRLAGTRRTERGDDVDVLPPSTTSDLLNGSSLPSLPRLTFVEAFVAACARASEQPPDQVERLVHRWRQAWRALGARPAFVTERPAVAEKVPAGGGWAPPIDHGWAQPIEQRTKPTHPVVRAELPTDIATFTGRHNEIERLTASLTGSTRPGLTPVHVVRGPAGVGKTALAVHVAHRLVEAFPDGQLYVDLRGADTDHPPRQPVDVLARWLRSLTGTDTVPTDLEEAAAWFRSLVAGRRLLFLLDNAFSGAQVRPLVPASPGCAVLVTSRGVLATLDGAAHLDLAVLSDAEAIELLGNVVGRDWVVAEPAAAARIAALCGHLPRKIRVAGSRLVARPGEPLAALATQLASDRHRDDRWHHGDLSVRPGVNGSYHELGRDDEPAARIFWLLGLLDIGELGLPAIAALAGTTPSDAGAALDRLTDARLLQAVSGDRYRMGEATRRYAQESSAGGQDGVEYRSALDNLLGRYLTNAERASAVLRPTDLRRVTPDGAWRVEPGAVTLRTPTDAIAWVDAEVATMISVTEQASVIPGPLSASAGKLALALYQPLSNRGRTEDRIQVGKVAVEAARVATNQVHEAQAIEDLGFIFAASGRVAEATDHTHRALDLWRELDDRHGEMMALLKLGFAFRLNDQFDRALAYLEKGLLVGRDINSATGQGFALNNLGLMYQNTGQFDRAILCHRHSIALHRGMGDPHGEAIAQADIGWAYQRSGNLVQAAVSHRSSLAVFRTFHDRYNEAEQLWGLGTVFDKLGNEKRALSYREESLAILDDIDAISPEEVQRFDGEPGNGVPQIIRANT